MGRLQANYNLSKNNIVSIKKQGFNSVTVAGTSPAYIFAGGETALTQLQNGITYKFFGGSNNTIGTFLNVNELTRSTSAADSDRLIVQQGGFTINYYAYSDNTWRMVGNPSDQSSVIIQEGASITFNTWDGAAKNVTVQGTNYVAIINNLNTFFNKDNFRKGTSAADSDVVQTVNPFGATHNFFVRASDNTWRRAGSSADQGSFVTINRNQKIVFISYDGSPIVINMIGNNFLKKLDSGKLNLNKKNISIPVSQRFVNVNWSSLLGVGLTNLTLDNNGLYPSDIAWAGYFNNPTEKEIVLAYNYNIPNTWEFSIFDTAQVYPSYHWRNASTDTSKIPLEGWVGINDENFNGGSWPLTAGTTNLFITSV